MKQYPNLAGEFEKALNKAGYITNNNKRTTMSDTRIETMVLYAWVGEDELGSGEVGLKQGDVPAGRIALVTSKEGRLDQPYIVAQLREQAKTYGKTIRLCRFVYAGEVLVLEP